MISRRAAEAQFDAHDPMISCKDMESQFDACQDDLEQSRRDAVYHAGGLTLFSRLTLSIPVSLINSLIVSDINQVNIEEADVYHIRFIRRRLLMASDA
jgi:hypothetical protein